MDLQTDATYEYVHATRLLPKVCKLSRAPVTALHTTARPRTALARRWAQFQREERRAAASMHVPVPSFTVSQVAGRRRVALGTVCVADGQRPAVQRSSGAQRASVHFDSKLLATQRRAVNCTAGAVCVWGRASEQRATRPRQSRECTMLMPSAGPHGKLACAPRSGPAAAGLRSSQFARWSAPLQTCSWQQTQGTAAAESNRALKQHSEARLR